MKAFLKTGKRLSAKEKKDVMACQNILQTWNSTAISTSPRRDAEE